MQRIKEEKKKRCCCLYYIYKKKQEAKTKENKKTRFSAIHKIAFLFTLAHIKCIFPIFLCNLQENLQYRLHLPLNYKNV